MTVGGRRRGGHYLGRSRDCDVRAVGVACASSWMMQPKPKGALSSAKQNHPTCESDASANWAKIQFRVRYRFIFIVITSITRGAHRCGERKSRGSGR